MSWNHRVKCLALTLILVTMVAQSWAETKPMPDSTTQAAAAKMLRLPLAFEPNQGQVSKEVRFIANGAGYSLFLTSDEAVFVFNGKHKQVLRMRLGAIASSVAGVDRSAGTTDYFLGNDSAKWVTNVPHFSKVAMGSVGRGIDLHFYGNNGHLEYDYALAPGANPRSVAIALSGARSLRVNRDGDLVISLDAGDVQFKKPLAYQDIDGKRIPVAANYELAANTVGFKVGAYDKTHTLVIDPVLNYSTYLGGTNPSSANAIAIDSGGLAYVAGNTSTTNFPSPVPSDACPTGTGSGQCGPKGSQDVFVARLSAGGEAVQKLSIIGGSGSDDAKAIAIGSGTPATTYVVGDTASTDFPVTTGSYQTTNGGGTDGFFFVLPAAGNSLTYSTYIGGANADHAYGIAVNGTVAHIVGGTASSGLFSTVQKFANLNGTTDGYLIKMDPAQSGTAALLWATYVGGAGDDDTRAVALFDANTAFITGTTGSASGFTATTLTGSPYQSTLSGATDAYVAKFDTRSPLGISGGGNAPKCDSSTNLITLQTSSNHGLTTGQWVVISGVTNSSNGVVYTGVRQITVTALNKFTYNEAATCTGGPANNDTGGVSASSKVTPALLFNTYLGGDATDGGSAIALNAAGIAFVAGATTSSAGFPASAIQNTYGGAGDGFVAQLSATGSSLNYFSYLGGTNADSATAIAVNPACAANCEAWVAGSTQSSTVPVFQMSQFGGGNLQGSQDGFVVRVNGTGTGVIFGSYVGGLGVGTADQINGIALKPLSNQVYVAGATDSNDLSVTSSAAQHSAPFSSSGFVAKLSGNSDPDPTLAITPNAPSANPLTSGQAVTYTWSVANTNSATNMTFDMPIPNDGGGNDYLNITSATPSCVFRQGSASTGAGGVTCQLADQPTANSQTVTLNATLNPAIAACITQPCAFSLVPKVAAAESEGAGNPKTSAATTGRVAQLVTLDVTGTTANSDVTGGAQYKDTKDTSITFTLSVHNPAANATDVNVNVAMVYPNNFLVDPPLAAGCSDSPGTHTVTCNVGTIGAGATVTANVTGHYTTVGAPDTLVHTLTATPATTSPTQVFVADNTKNQNVAFNVSYLGPTADLAVTNPLTITPSPVHVNDPILIQAFYTNKPTSDPTTTTTLTFTFDQPFTATGLPAACTQPGGTGANVICALGPLAAGASGSITITGPAPLANSAGSAAMNVSATITATGASVVSPADDTGFAIIGVIRYVALSVSNFAVTPNTSIHDAQSVTYSVDVMNAGLDPATNISTVFTLTAGYTNFVPVNGGCVPTNSTTITCTNAGPLPSGASQTNISFTVTPPSALIPPTSPSAPITASVAVSTSAANLDTGATPAAGPLNTTVERRTDINITSFSRTTPSPIGQTGTVTYSAIVQNDGVNDAKNVRIHFDLPSNYIINAGSTSANCNVNVTTTGRDCDIATLQPGAANAVTLNVAFTPAAGTVPTTAPNATINVNVNVDTAQVAIGNIDGTTGTKARGPVSTVVERRANVALTSFSGPATSPDGQNIIYNAGINNAGPDTAEGVKLDITFGPAAAAGFSFVSTMAPGGCTIFSPTVLRCTVGSLGNGASSSFSVTIKPPVGFLAGTASKNLTADTLVSGNYVDGTPGNDSQPQVSTSVQAAADLTVSMVPGADPTNLSAGESYTITAANSPSSPSIATNVRVRITMASNSGRTFTANSAVGTNWSCGALPVIGGSTLTCTYALPLNPGDLATPLTVSGDVFLPPNQQNGNITSTAVLDTFPATVVETNAADNTSAPVVLIQRLADLGLAPINTTPYSGATAGTPNSVYQQGVHDHLLYQIDVTNFGPDQATGVTVQAAAPAGSALYGGNPTPFTYTDSVGTGNCTLGGGNFTCSGLTINSGATASIVLDMVPAQISTQSGTLNTNWAANSIFLIDSNGFGGANNQSSSVTIERHGDFSVSISTPAGPVVTGFTGNTITYDVTVTGDPTLNLTNVTVQDVLPTNLAFNSTSVPAGVVCTPSGNLVTCTIATLNAGTNKVFSITATPSVPNSTSQVTVQNTVTGSTSSIVDDNPGNNTSTSGGTVLYGDTDLQVNVTSAPVGGTAPGANAGEVIAGQSLRYTITVTNNGPHQSDAITLNHVIPAGTTLVSVSGGSFNCMTPNNLPCTLIGTLPAGSTSGQLVVTVSVPASAVAADSQNLTYNVTATNFSAPSIAANTTDPNNGNNNVNQVTVARQTANMQLTAGVTPTLLQPGNTAHFNITVSNVSTLNASSNTTVIIPINASPVSNSSVASAIASQGSCAALAGGGTAGASITCNLGAIAVGANATVDVAVTPALPGQVQITPAVSVSNVDPDATNNSASVTLLTGNTPPGSNITIHPAHPTTGATNNEISVFFGNVNAPGGNTTAISYAAIPAAPPAAPSGFHYVNSPLGVQLAYDLNTSANYSGLPQLVCFSVGSGLAKPERVRVYANNQDITVVNSFSVTTTGGNVCGDTTLLAPNALNSTLTFRVVEPNNNPPSAVATNTSSSTTGKGLTGAGVRLVATSSSDDSNTCIVSVSGTPTARNCRDLENALLTWTGQFTDGNQKQVQCTGVGGVTDGSAVPPRAAYPACLTLDVSVPFGQQNIALQITDPYGATSALASTQVNSTGSASGSTSGTVTINAGQSATYTVNATGGGGVTTISIVSIAPATNTITCSVTPSSFTGTGTPSLSVGCSTQAPIFAKADPTSVGTSDSPMLAGVVGITALPLVGMLLLPGRGRRQKRIKVLAILGLVMLVTLFMGACGGGGNGSNFGGSAKLQSSGTPKGMYTVTLGASGGGFCDSNGSNCTATRNLSLVVQ